MIAAVILAAGDASRLGGRSKANFAFCGTSLLNFAARNLEDAGVQHIHVCLKERDAHISNLEQSLQCASHSHSVPKTGVGLSESLKSATEFFSKDHFEGISALLFHQVDRPSVTPLFLRGLIAQFFKTRQAVICNYENEWMPPVILPRELFEKVSLLSADTGLKKLFVEKEFEFNIVDASAEFAFSYDIDTPVDLHNLKHFENFTRNRAMNARLPNDSTVQA